MVTAQLTTREIFELSTGKRLSHEAAERGAGRSNCKMDCKMEMLELRL